MSIRYSESLLTLAPRALFKALGDPNRLRLFANLACCKKPCTIGEASGCCPTDPSVASRHIAILRDAGLIECTKRGKEVLVSANVNTIVATLRALADALERCCGASCGGGNSGESRPVSSGSKPKTKRRKR